METKTISARVPLKFANEFSDWAKANNSTVSAEIQKMFEKVDQKNYLMKTDSTFIDESTKDFLLTLAGGSTIAILVYKAIATILADKYPMMDSDEIKAYAIAGAAASGLLGGIGINKLLKM